MQKRSKTQIAKGVYQCQKARCYNPKDPRYSTYGAKGVCVEYTQEEFVEWYLKNVPSGFHVGRIDHDKNYSFHNIEIQTVQENSRERIARLGPPAGRKQIVVTKNGSFFGEYESIMSAAQATGYDRANIANYLKNKPFHKTRNGFTYQYKENFNANKSL